jgi:general stress protein YciG
MAIEDRGFASMDRTKQREIASKGGRAAHQKGTGHEWVSGTEEHHNASVKGGMTSARVQKARREQAKMAASARQQSEQIQEKP